MIALKRKVAIVALSAIVALVMAVNLCYAQDGNETATVVEVDAMPYEEVLATIGRAIPVGFVVGFITAFLGYMSKTDPEKTFSLPKLLGTVLFALLIGTIMSATGWDYVSTEAWAGTAGLTIWAYWLAEFVSYKLGWSAEPPATPKPTT